MYDSQLGQVEQIFHGVDRLQATLTQLEQRIFSDEDQQIQSQGQVNQIKELA